jgi:hypothetical protein
MPPRRRLHSTTINLAVLPVLPRLQPAGGLQGAAHR